MAMKANVTEHGCGKTSDAKSGFWGLRRDAKSYSSKVRRTVGKRIVRNDLKDI